MKKSYKLIYLTLLSSIVLFSCKNNNNSSSNEFEQGSFNNSSDISESLKDSESLTDSDSSSANKDSSNANNSSSNSDSSILEDTSSGSDSSTPSYVTLNTPTLSLDENSGVVTISEDADASFYRYYINCGEYQTTNSNTITLTNGQTLVVCADNQDEYILPSSWSNPITYFEKEAVNNEMIKIFLHNSDFNAVEIVKGSTYTPSTPTNKEGYTFENWYVDPFYSEVFDASKPINENTILYAHYTKDACIENSTYWIKANSHISHPDQKGYAGSSWKFIPLTLKDNTNPKIFEATVQVSNTSTSSYGQFLVMDGFDDNPGRTYWKNNDSDFTINTDGTYKISFSLEKEWLNGSNYVHCHVEQITSNINPRRPLNANNNDVSELDIPVVTIDKENNLASWTTLENASYAYQIDNGEVKYTNDNNVTLNENSFIVVKAISKNGNYLDSKWSNPYIYIIEYEQGKQYYYVYFNGSNLPAVKVEKGQKVSKPSTPSKSKYTFDNWYTTINKTTLFDFDSPINKNTVVYSKWIPLEDYKTTVYYTLEKQDGSKIGDLTLYEDNLSYNEFYISYSLTSSETLYVKRVSDGKKFGPYVMDSAGNYDMYFSEEHIWDVNTSKARNAYWSLQEMTLYFTNALYWSDVYYYTWNDDGWKDAWPGEKMTYVRTNSYGQDIYKVTLPTNTYEYIIFNGGKDKPQTVNINISSAKNNDAFYSKDEKDGNNHKYGTYTYS